MCNICVPPRAHRFYIGGQVHGSRSRVVQYLVGEAPVELAYSEGLSIGPLRAGGIAGSEPFGGRANALRKRASSRAPFGGFGGLGWRRRAREGSGMGRSRGWRRWGPRRRTLSWRRTGPCSVSQVFCVCVCVRLCKKSPCARAGME